MKNYNLLKAKIITLAYSELLALSEKTGHSELFKGLMNGNLNFVEVSNKLNLESEYDEYQSKLSQLSDKQTKDFVELLSDFKLFLLAHICFPHDSDV